MEPILPATRRSIEMILDEWAEISARLPDTPARQALNARAERLEELLLHLDECPVDLIDVLTDGGLEVPESMLDEEERQEGTTVGRIDGEEQRKLGGGYYTQAEVEEIMALDSPWGERPTLFAEDNGVPLGRTLRSITGTYCAICGGPMHGEHHVDPGDDADHKARIRTRQKRNHASTPR